MVGAKGHSKQLYSLVCELTGTKVENQLPDYVADIQLAEDFADFFLNKIDTIRQSLKDIPTHEPKRKNVPCFGKFQELTTDKVSKLISELNTKSCKLDALYTSV